MSPSKEWNILFERCVPHQHWVTQKGTLFLSVNQHDLWVLWLRTRGESLAGPILQNCLCPLRRALFPMVTRIITYLEGNETTAIRQLTFRPSCVIALLICPQLLLDRARIINLSISRRRRIKTSLPLKQTAHVAIVYLKIL